MNMNVTGCFPKVLVVSFFFLIGFNLTLFGNRLPEDPRDDFFRFWHKADSLILLVGSDLFPDILDGFNVPQELYNEQTRNNNIVDQLLRSIGDNNAPARELIIQLEVVKKSIRGDRPESDISADNFDEKFTGLFYSMENIAIQTLPDHRFRIEETMNDLRSHPGFSEHLLQPVFAGTSVDSQRIAVEQSGSEDGAPGVMTGGRMVIIGLLGIIIAAIAFLYIKFFLQFNRLSKDFSSEVEIRRSGEKEFGKQLKALRDSTDTKQAFLDQSFDRLRQLVNQLEEDVTAIKGVTGNSGQADIEPLPAVESPKQTKAYYLPNADQNGFFWDDKKTNSLESGSTYRLEIDLSRPGSGDFYLLTENERVVRNAVANPSYLKSVCDIQNLDDGGRNIEIIKPGRLKLVNDRWVVDSDQKHVIRFC